MDMGIALGMLRNAIEAVFHFFPWKVCFPFLECQNWVFSEAANETAN
jgi:hypothetical protein